MWQIILMAGWPIWPLMAASVLAIAIIGERLWTLRVKVVVPSNLLHEVESSVSKSGVNRAFIDHLKQHSPLGMVLASALSHIRSRDLAKEAIEETGRAVAHDLEKYLSTLGTIATIAPLLGLLGTVIGMVELFGAFTNAGHDVAQFARGISVALYNTAAGIIVAVPAMIAYRYFRSRVDGFLVDMEQQAIRLIATLYSEEQGNESATR